MSSLLRPPLTEWQERFLAGLFATWFATRRKHVKPNAKEREAGEACAESARFTFNALLRTLRKEPKWEMEPNEPKHLEAWGEQCWCGEIHNGLRLVQ